MDELWQRYRPFWRPVLLGLGVFLLALIAVHIVTPNPEDASARVASTRQKLAALVRPKDRVAGELRNVAEAYGDSVKALAAAFDPSSQGRDLIELYVNQALQAAFGRGGVGSEAFDGDRAAAAQAAKDVERLTRERTALFRAANPNVAFIALLSDVWGELKTRANRADMDLDADLLGFANVSTVTRAELEQRLANLALVSRITDVAIRRGGRSLDAASFANPPAVAPDAFLREWPLTVTLTASTACVEALLDMLTDPKAPVPLSALQVRQPLKGKAAQGIVEATMTLDCVAVRPAATLNLDTQEG
jgi:hypothetical protein